MTVAKHLIFLTFTLLFTQNLMASTLYAVKGVANNDHLNVREKPSASSNIITRIPHNGTNITLLTESKYAPQWVKISWNEKRGWVNRHYLKALITPKKVKPQLVMKCGGTEPFWGMEISQSNMRFIPMDGSPAISVTPISQLKAQNNPGVAVILGGEKMTTTLRKQSCSDGMSDIKYSYSVTAVINKEQVYAGCCRVE